MNDSSLRILTTWEAQKIFGILGPTIDAAIERGDLVATKIKKGNRDCYVFTLLAFLEFLLSSRAGKHQLQAVILPLAAITPDPAFQTRAKVRFEVVKEYAELLESGAVFPPIVTVRLGSHLVVTDGYHRLEAHRIAGRTEIAVFILEHCSEAEAIALSVKSNRTNGLPRSKSDKKKLLTFMLTRPEYANMSTRDLATQCGLSHMTVSRFRSRLVRAHDTPKEKLDSTGTPPWIVGKIRQLISLLRITHPEIAGLIDQQLNRIEQK